MTIWRMRNACWIPNATNTHSFYVILITFPLQLLHEHASFYVLCPSPRTFRSPGLCKLPVAVPFQTSYLQSTNIDAIPIFPSLFISRPKSRQSLVCVFLHILAAMGRATVMYVYSQCCRIIFIGRKSQAAQWTRVNTRGIDEMSVRALKGSVNFYCRCGKGLVILYPYYAGTSCWTETRVTLICRQNTAIPSERRSQSLPVTEEQHILGGADCRCLSTCRAGVDVRICGGQSGTGTDCFFKVLQFSPVSIIPQLLRNHLASTRCCQHNDKRAKLGKSQKPLSFGKRGALGIWSDVIASVDPDVSKESNATIFKGQDFKSSSFRCRRV